MNNNVNYKYEEKYLDILKTIVLNIFSDVNCSIFLFGSHVSKNIRRDSDYDICIQDVSKDTFRKKQTLLDSELEESIVPHKVDLLNYSELSSEFVKIAFKDIIYWKKS